MTADPVASHFDDISRRYRQVPGSWRSVYDKARSIIEPLIKDKIVLDVGNGGTFVYDTRLPRQLTVLDISPKMLESVRDPAIVKLLGDARDLAPVADGSQDVIVYLMTLHHLNGPRVRRTFGVLDQVLGAAHRKLRAGGTLLIAEPVFPAVFYYPQAFFFAAARWLLSRFGVPMVFFFRKNGLCERLAGAFGLSTAQIEVTDLPVTGWVDPLGGTFPGRVRIPAWLCPTRCYLFKVCKNQ